MVKSESINNNLPGLPSQPGNVSWPTENWERAELAAEDPERFEQLASEIFDLQGSQGVTYTLLVIKNGQLCYERYDAGANPLYMQYSWSMAKSVTHALTGILVGQGKLDLYGPAPVPEWQDDSRRDITLDQLLRMSSGLEFHEDYVDGAVSDVIPMLMSDGRHDVAAFAAAKPLGQIVVNMLGIGKCYYKKKEIENSEKHLLKAYDIAKEIGMYHEIQMIETELSKISNN